AQPLGCRWRELQRPDLHLALFDGAAGGSFFTIAKLKRDRTFRELTVLDIDCLNTIERDRQLRAFGRDLIVVPFAACFGQRRYLGDIGDGSGAVLRVWALVVDIRLVRGFRSD